MELTGTNRSRALLNQRSHFEGASDAQNVRSRLRRDVRFREAKSTVDDEHLHNYATRKQTII